MSVNSISEQQVYHGENMSRVHANKKSASSPSVTLCWIPIPSLRSSSRRHENNADVPHHVTFSKFFPPSPNHPRPPAAAPPIPPFLSLKILQIPVNPYSLSGILTRSFLPPKTSASLLKHRSQHTVLRVRRIPRQFHMP